MGVCPPEAGRLARGFTFVLVRGGWIGVDLFFVLSGFLVSGLLFKEYQNYRSISPRSFLIRRGLKIYPAFYVFIITTVLVSFLSSSPVEPANLARELVFLQNYGGGLWNHTWSLAIEEHFYLALLAIAVLLVRRRGANDGNPFSALPLIFVAVATACFILRLLTAMSAPYSHERNLFPTHLRIDSLLLGVLISYYYHYRAAELRAFSERYRRLLFVGGLACVAPAFILILDVSRFMYTAGLTFLFLGFGMILVASMYRELRPTIPVRALSFIGSRSYSIYLWHMAVKKWVAVPLFGSSLASGPVWYLYAAFYLAGAIAVGIGMAWLVEIPVLNLRDRLFPSRSRALAAEADGVAVISDPLPVVGKDSGRY